MTPIMSKSSHVCSAIDEWQWICFGAESYAHYKLQRTLSHPLIFCIESGTSLSQNLIQSIEWFPLTERTISPYLTAWSIAYHWSTCQKMIEVKIYQKSYLTWLINVPQFFIDFAKVGITDFHTALVKRDCFIVVFATPTYQFVLIYFCRPFMITGS